ncbi:PASTA domain-containing protein [Pseudoclavibacter chungangensis]|uniref:PASTA domain-containing protein n=1 Tax=Pseudoclavibacter chungangensis TaxID=587635 RepID=A0A7J5BR26_9MICO|nr:transglycosylase domain-containing protein [Pseudoclavibacter chungangensis]KAB1656762.1 PASTA domain-containing protein [Pseudoclavibacter chungangensis]NYJ67775.1 membrane peptidoglycan carboxypeptidase [Pseudoclavibacter chungangensis]
MAADSTAIARGSRVSGILGWVGSGGIAALLVGVLITPLLSIGGLNTSNTVALFETLPDHLEIGPLQQKTELYAMKGGEQVKFAEFYAQNREEVALDQISPYLQDAAVATEDPRFRDHGGVDVISTARAVAGVLLGSSSAGASTITMQYVRNVLIQNALSLPDETERDEAYRAAVETSAGRKLQEMRLAIGVEKQYSKDEILQGYLNIALFGDTVYGVESAAYRYFGKSAADVTLAEAASLIAMVQEPNAYRLDIEDNIPGNQERRDYVLMRMLDEGKITQEEHDEAVATPVTPNIQANTHGCQNATDDAQYFCDYVRRVLLNDQAFGSTFEERQFSFETKGYQIFTTLDLDLQASARATMASAVPSSMEGVDIGAAASMVENGTGKILAMVQNTTFDETEAAAATPGATSINYNTDYEYGGSTGFQVGSTYKIFTLAEWIAEGHSLYESVPAQNRSFNQANFRDTCGPDNGGPWAPTNDGGARFGSVSALTATTGSINTAYVAMAEQLDQCRIRDTAIALGAHRADHQMNLSLPSAVLGTNEIAPLAMAQSISGLAAGGSSCSPIAIDRIELRDGTPVTAPPSNCIQAVTPEVAATVNEALEATASGGTAAPSNPGIVPMTGKTGTTDDAIHTWIVGATSKVGLAVWVGNASGQASMYNLDLPLASGSQTRHVIFKDIMSVAMQKYGGDAFPTVPESTTEEEAATSATIPDLTGRTTDEARTLLESLGYSVAIGSPVVSAQRTGTVDHTIPSPNTRVNTKTTVVISPSVGDSLDGAVIMPDVSGMSFDDALGNLAASGLTGGTRYEMQEANSQVPAGTVIRSNPVPGTPVDPSIPVELFVSTG